MNIRNPFVPKEHERYRFMFKIRDLRVACGLTQKQAAEIAGIDESTVRNYELGRRYPTPEHAQGLARAYKVMPEALLPYDDMITSTETLVLLWDLCRFYGFTPGFNEKYAYLSPGNDAFKSGVSRWAQAYAALEKSEEKHRESYERWKDDFHEHFDKEDFPRIYPEYDPVDATSQQRWERELFASSLKRERERSGMTQEELAKKSGVSKSAIRSYEQGKRLPREKQLGSIRGVLGLGPASLTHPYLGSPNRAMHNLFALTRYMCVKPLIDEDAGPVLAWFRALEGYGVELLAKKVDELGSVRRSEESIEHWLNRLDMYSDDFEADYKKTRYGESLYFDDSHEVKA